MNIIYLMIPCTLILVAGFVWAFIWANNNKQFDDLVTPSHKMLNDDLPTKNTTTEHNNEKEQKDVEHG